MIASVNTLHNSYISKDETFSCSFSKKLDTAFENFISFDYFDKVIKFSLQSVALPKKKITIDNNINKISTETTHQVFTNLVIKKNLILKTFFKQDVNRSYDINVILINKKTNKRIKDLLIPFIVCLSGVRKPIFVEMKDNKYTIDVAVENIDQSIFLIKNIKLYGGNNDLDNCEYFMCNFESIVTKKYVDSPFRLHNHTIYNDQDIFILFGSKKNKLEQTHIYVIRWDIQNNELLMYGGFEFVKNETKTEIDRIYIMSDVVYFGSNDKIISFDLSTDYEIAKDNNTKIEHGLIDYNML